MNLNLEIVKQAVTSRAARQVLLAQKHSPVILFGAGVMGMTATVVLACKATLQVDNVLDKLEADKEKIENALTEHAEVYSEHDAKQDKLVAYSKAAGTLVKLYAPAAIVGILAVGCLAGGQVILTRRNVALTAAYAAVDKAFKDYRQAVVQDLGEEKDQEFRYGVESREVVSETKKGGHRVDTVKYAGQRAVSQYAKFFDEVSPAWEPNAELNLLFIKCQQNWANDRLRSRGHLFLNEVYDSLGIERSKAGACVGWVISKDGGDNFVDFGVFDAKNNAARDFVNGRERSILLDFNVDGVILDKI